MSLEMTPDQISSAYLSAACAAKWWADRLHDGAGVGDNGGKEYENKAAGYFSRMLRACKPPTAANCVRFENALRVALADALCAQRGIGDVYDDQSGWDDGGIDLRLRVDYHPCPVLREALTIAGVDPDIAANAALPLKTVMKVSARRVLVSYGYGAPFVEIYGPVWGATHAEFRAAEELRDAAINHIYDAMAQGESLFGCEWKGPVRTCKLDDIKGDHDR